MSNQQDLFKTPHAQALGTHCGSIAQYNSRKNFSKISYRNATNQCSRELVIISLLALKEKKNNETHVLMFGDYATSSLNVEF